MKGGRLPFPSLEVTLAAPVTRSGPVVRAQAVSEDGSLPPTRSCQPGRGPVAPGARQLPAGPGQGWAAAMVLSGGCPAFPQVAVQPSPGCLPCDLSRLPMPERVPQSLPCSGGPGGETDSPASCSASFPESSLGWPLSPGGQGQFGGSGMDGIEPGSVSGWAQTLRRGGTWQPGCADVPVGARQLRRPKVETRQKMPKVHKCFYFFLT